MFGRKKKRQFASQTITDKYALASEVRNEIHSGVWLEDGDHPAAKSAVAAYLQRIETTDDIVFLTLNSLSHQICVLEPRQSPLV